MAAPASDLLSHFWLLDFSSETAERNSTKLDRKQDLNAIYQGSVFRAGRKNKMAAPASDWLRHFRLLISERNSKKLDRKQDLNVLYQVHVFFSWSIWKKRWPHRPLICRDIFDFSSKTAEPNPTKLDRKQDLNVIYQVCVFFSGRSRSEKQDGHPASDLLWHFWLLLWNHWTEFNETCQEARSQRPLPSLCFSGWSEKQDGHPAPNWVRHFRLL